MSPFTSYVYPTLLCAYPAARPLYGVPAVISEELTLVLLPPLSANTAELLPSSDPNRRPEQLPPLPCDDTVLVPEQARRSSSDPWLDTAAKAGRQAG